MDPIEMIQQTYTQVADGIKRIDLKNDSGATVKAYWAGMIIRINVKNNNATKTEERNDNNL